MPAARVASVFRGISKRSRDKGFRRGSPGRGAGRPSGLKLKVSGARPGDPGLKPKVSGSLLGCETLCFSSANTAPEDNCFRRSLWSTDAAHKTGNLGTSESDPDTIRLGCWFSHTNSLRPRIVLRIPNPSLFPEWFPLQELPLEDVMPPKPKGIKTRANLYSLGLNVLLDPTDISELDELAPVRNRIRVDVASKNIIWKWSSRLAFYPSQLVNATDLTVTLKITVVPTSKHRLVNKNLQEAV
ncbi:hypothetical protein B0H12DRAFT_1303325 [Mycena haematopus]|nr:hypothetical protein B0H12DRAFT_1303325 [Mycena haematopus]